MVFDVEELSTHGGSLRVFARHADDALRAVAAAWSDALLASERDGGYASLEGYGGFGSTCARPSGRPADVPDRGRRDGRSVAGYGAPGKGNTLLNYCGIRTDLLDYTVDRNPYKHGRFTPGTRIPIHDPARLAETRPDDDPDPALEPADGDRAGSSSTRVSGAPAWSCRIPTTTEID